MNAANVIVSPLNRIDRVRRNTAPEFNQRIDRQTELNIRFYSTQPPEAISERVRELEEEWDIERLLEVSASALALSGMLLSVLRGRSWLAVSALVMGFLFLHGTQGWCPPLPVLRRMGVRTRQEIDREKFALCSLRGEAIVSSMAAQTASAAPTGQ